MGGRNRMSGAPPNGLTSGTGCGRDKVLRPKLVNLVVEACIWNWLMGTEGLDLLALQ